MNRYIITDSTAYLDQATLKEKGIIVIPLNVHIKDQSYQEGIDISNSDYYHILKSEPIFPTTSQPASGDFLQVFDKMQVGDEALIITLSAKLSGTMQSAQIAREMSNYSDKIFIHDSKSAAAGMAFQVLKAHDLLKAGWDMASVVRELEGMRERVRIFFMVSDLEYLARGGRIGKAAKYLGNILQLKPILWVDDGEINLFDKVRSRQKAIKSLISQVEEAQGSLEAVTVIGIDAQEEARNLQETLQERFTIPVGISEAGPVIGSHIGSGGLGVAFVKSKID
ncbi:MAG TPA: DegV family protein [Syntrophomonadaceae bacterium]|nr:DegV family protein [Syntrophomonadaceae bacterium]